MIGFIFFSIFTFFESESKECEKLISPKPDFVQNDGYHEFLQNTWPPTLFGLF